MFEIRQAGERGAAEIGWLSSRHTFSFADYYDPQHMGFGPLRVINEDRVQPGEGFPTHGHRDMEILSYVLDGALEHKDNIGNGSITRPGDVQRMTAGTGVMHSEFNHSKTELVHFLQIWIVPDQKNLAPGYEQKAFSREEKQGKLRLVGSKDGRDGSVTIHQDADLYAGILESPQRISHPLRAGRRAWLQITRGQAEVNGHSLSEGDGAAIADLAELALTGDAEILLFDMI